MQLFSADATMFSNYFFLTTKSLKTHPKKLLIIGPDPFFFSAAPPAQNSPEVHSRFINSPIHSSVLKSVIKSDHQFAKKNV